VRHVVLVGLMGAGKSTVGRALAARLGQPFVDNDDALQRRTGRSARDIAAADGVDALHAQEAATLLATLEATEPAVIAAAAAAVLDPAVAAALPAHYVVYLRAAPVALAVRVAADDNAIRPTGDRPPAEVLHDQFAQRDAVYTAQASLVVDATQPIDAIVASISAAA
jgi:shikimate kinase